MADTADQKKCRAAERAQKLLVRWVGNSFHRDAESPSRAAVQILTIAVVRAAFQPWVKQVPIFFA